MAIALLASITQTHRTLEQPTLEGKPLKNVFATTLLRPGTHPHQARSYKFKPNPPGFEFRVFELFSTLRIMRIRGLRLMTSRYLHISNDARLLGITPRHNAEHPPHPRHLFCSKRGEFNEMVMSYPSFFTLLSWMRIGPRMITSSCAVEENANLIKYVFRVLSLFLFFK